MRRGDLKINRLRKLISAPVCSQLNRAMQFPNSLRPSARLKLIFLGIAALSCVFVFSRLLSQRFLLHGSDFPEDYYNTSGTNSYQYDSYAAILNLDKQTQFLDSETRRFLQRSHFYVFPSKYKKVFLETLLEFDRIWRQKLNRTYLLNGGTLLGAYRHGQTIPWDDDLDILVDLKYNATIEKDFKESKFTVSKTLKENLRKLFFTSNDTTTNQYGHWPFIDLFFYKTLKKGTQIELQGWFKVVYPTKYVFPVIRMPFEGHKFLAPRCPKEIARLTANSEIFWKCCTHIYNHKRDKTNKKYCISCSKLLGLLPFVTWARVNSTHSQQMISEPHPLHKMATLYKRKEGKWKVGQATYMPQC